MVNFNGNLICESLNVTATGIVDGEVQANALSIDLGCRSDRINQPCKRRIKIDRPKL